MSRLQPMSFLRRNTLRLPLPTPLNSVLRCPKRRIPRSSPRPPHHCRTVSKHAIMNNQSARTQDSSLHNKNQCACCFERLRHKLLTKPENVDPRPTLQVRAGHADLIRGRCRCRCCCCFLLLLVTTRQDNSNNTELHSLGIHCETTTLGRLRHVDNFLS